MQPYIPFLAIAAAAWALAPALHAATPVPNTQYTVHGRHSNACLGASTTPEAKRCAAGSWAQNWRLMTVDAGAGLYMLENRQLGQCLLSHADISDGAFHFGACNPAWWAAHWYVTPIDSEHYQIKNRHSQYCLDSHADVAQGALGKLACNAAYWSQHWQWLPAASSNVSWSPFVANDCHIFNDYPQNGWYRVPSPPSSNCNFSAQGGKPLAWTMLSGNEAVGTYTPGPIIPENRIGEGKLWNPNFHASGGGTYRIAMSLDKITHADYRDQYTFASWGDNFDQNYVLAKPDLGRNVYLDMRVGLLGASRAWESATGLGKGRLTLGVLARWAGKDHYLEVVLWRDPEFDGCTATENWWGTHPSVPCDSTGLYDRRSDWGTGEAVYYYAGALNQILGHHVPPLSASGTTINYRLPISRLFQSYSWQVMPSSWSGVEIAGVYLGIEALGKSWVWFEMDSYRLYEVGQ